jgi:serine/threonine protein kinase
MSDHKHGTPAEWFAVGITLYEFLVGSRPFETPALQAFKNHTQGASEKLPYTKIYSLNHVSAACKDFLLLLLKTRVNRLLFM